MADYCYKIILSYDGTDYAGWIQQRGKPSIVQTLQDSFKNLFGHPITILGASRTDAGVHAMGQVARFHSPLILTSKQHEAWNNALPDAITILSLQEQPGFHPFHDVERKVYQYRFTLKRPLPFQARYLHQVTYPLDMNKLTDALALFKGTHNFAAFYTGNNRSDTIRTIETVSLSHDAAYDAYCIMVIGQKFLRHMVRRMVGAALAVAIRPRLPLSAISQALETGKMNTDLPTAPAQGLMLYKIEYKNKGL